jgi:hypothetical protein
MCEGAKCTCTPHTTEKTEDLQIQVQTPNTQYIRYPVPFGFIYKLPGAGWCWFGHARFYPAIEAFILPFLDPIADSQLPQP